MQKQISNGVLRILSGVTIGLLCILVSFGNSLVQTLFLLGILIRCSIEIYGFYHQSDKVSGFISLTMSVLGGVIGYHISSELILWLSVGILLMLVISLFFYKGDKGFNRLSMINFMVYPGLCLGLLANFLSQNVFPFAILLFYFTLIWSSDVGAYYVGKQYGKRKLAQYISPNKTIEGFIGGGLTCVMITLVWHFAFLVELHLARLCTLSMVIWMFCSIGDLVQSKLKRQFDIKDSGKLIPGHGGFFDRFDGFIFAAPFFILTYNLLY